MARTNLLEELKRRPLVCDGAMGTQLIARGLQPGACGELWNLERPESIEDVHRAYREAGCDLVTTNTFGGTTCVLEPHGLAGQVANLNQAAARLARQAVGEEGWVLGDIGPFGGFLEPLGEMTVAQLESVFRQQAAALQAGGADGLIIETMADPAEVRVAVQAGKKAAAWPVIATYAFNRSDGDGAGFRTMMGTPVEDAMVAALDAGADVVGANCGTSLSLDDYLRLAERLMKAAKGAPVILQPNAGSPRMIDGKLVHPASPAEMAAMVQRLLDLGVAIIGGCCGTTPAHLQAMAAEVKRLAAR